MSIVLWVFQVVGRSRTLYFLAENVPLSSILLSHEPLFRITMSLNSVPHSIVCHFLAIFSVTCSRRSSHWSEGDDQLSKTHMDGKGSQNHSARFSDRGYNLEFEKSVRACSSSWLRENAICSNTSSIFFGSPTREASADAPVSHRWKGLNLACWPENPWQAWITLIQGGIL